MSTTVKPDDWDNKLIVNADAITLALKVGQTLTIVPKATVRRLTEESERQSDSRYSHLA